MRFHRAGLFALLLALLMITATAPVQAAGLDEALAHFTEGDFTEITSGLAAGDGGLLRSQAGSAFTKVPTVEVAKLIAIGKPAHHDKPCATATPPSALMMTTTSGGVRQTLSRTKPSSARPKSAGLRTELVQTGL